MSYFCSSSFLSLPFSRLAFLIWIFFPVFASIVHSPSSQWHHQVPQISQRRGPSPSLSSRSTSPGETMVWQIRGAGWSPVRGPPGPPATRALSAYDSRKFVHWLMNWFFTKKQRLGVVVNEAERPVYSVRVDNTFGDLLLSGNFKMDESFYTYTNDLYLLWTL